MSRDGEPDDDPGDQRVAPRHEPADEGAVLLPGRHRGDQDIPRKVKCFIRTPVFGGIFYKSCVSLRDSLSSSDGE